LLAWFFTDEEFKLYSDSHPDVLEKYVVGTVPKTVQKSWFAKKGKRCKKVGLPRKVRSEDGWLSCKSRLRKHRVMTMMEYFRLLVCSCESPSRWLLVCGIVI